MTTDLKAHIKDLEAQIDFLIGYSNQGLHWKQEYHLRDDLIMSFLADESTPPNLVDKVNHIMEKIYELRQGIKTDQNYLVALEDRNIQRYIPVGGMTSGEIILYGKRDFTTYADLILDNTN